MYKCYDNVRQMNEKIEPCVSKAKNVHENLSRDINKLYIQNSVKLNNSEKIRKVWG
jgi:hypothetical protein